MARSLGSSRSFHVILPLYGLLNVLPTRWLGSQIPRSMDPGIVIPRSDPPEGDRQRYKSFSVREQIPIKQDYEHSDYEAEI